MNKKIYTNAGLSLILTLAFGAAYGDAPIVTTGLEPLPADEYAKEPPKARARSSTILSSVDLSSFFPPPGNQGAMGSCSSWAISYAARSYYYAKIINRQPTTYDEIASPSYVYHQTTTNPNANGSLCGGAYFRTALQLLINQGTVSWTQWPYTDRTCMPSTPTSEQSTQAEKWKIPAYLTINFENLKSIDSYKENIERGHPVIVGMRINTQEFSNIYGKGVYTLGPDSLNASGKHGYHAMVVVGYDDNKKAANGEVGALRIMNSWGQNWGDNGFVWVSYNAFKQMIGEAYLISGLAPPIVPRDDAEPAPEPDLSLELEKIIAEFRTGELKLDKDGDKYTIIGHGCVDEVKFLRKRVSKFGDKVQVLAEETPWPACEVRGILKTAIARGGLEAMVDNLESDKPNSSRGVEVSDIDENVSITPILRAGDKFKISVLSDEEAPYIQVYYLQADQTAKELYSGIVKKNSAGQHQLIIGAPPSMRRLSASAPFGTEALMVLSGKSEILPIRIKSNFAEASFMDTIRNKLSEIVENRDDIRASVVQVEVQDKPSSSSYLITESEFKSFGETEFAPSSGIMKNIGNTFGPKINIISPNLNANLSGKVAIKANFTNPNDAKIKPETIRVKYRTPVAWFDVTERVKANAKLDANGISANPMSLPKGKHLIRISVSDTKNRESIVEIMVQVS